jgi:hypothetical protein
MRRNLRLASYPITFLLGFGLGLYVWNDAARNRTTLMEFSETLVRGPLESILFEEGTDELKIQLIHAQLAFTDRQVAKGIPLFSSGDSLFMEYELGYARLAVFSELKGDAASGKDYMQKGIAYCLRKNKHEECTAEKLHYLADMLDHRVPIPSIESK